MSSTIWRSLAVGRSKDPHEREADQVASSPAMSGAANLTKIAEQQQLRFELMNDLGVTEPQLRAAAEALAAAAMAAP
ncbi:hypothetical protein GCM10009557_31850 [Virgisporangium ochraceum]|uniref:Uncharacterized protein n=1 Tax=Virgisporangium ochraceum TaxID=65505 RepID=A0A8J4A3L0_9ACTN|nr:hypothetical protein [Virgisporangium ochraceum]GIJ75094.1 hypothetical protein Voc01_100110 [Virgisporangium ochraceum]